MTDYERAMDLCYLAWTVIANVSEGDWTRQPPEWREAATAWRDAFHLELNRLEPHALDAPAP
jgi:hypothetical protein